MKKILLAENNPFLIGIYAGQLRKLGFDTIVAPDGEIAINRIKNINPDLLVLDAGLPKVNGLGVLKAIRQEMGLNELKVIMLSDFGYEADNEKTKELGVLKCFSKAECASEEIAGEIKKLLS